MKKYRTATIEEQEHISMFSLPDTWKTATVLSEETGLSKNQINAMRRDTLHVSAPSEYLRLIHRKRPFLKYNCPICGKEFESRSYKPPKYCSCECRFYVLRKQSKTRKRINRWKKLALRVHMCPVCSKLTTRRKYCSKECSDIYWKNRTYEKVCVYCQKQFMSKTAATMFCSPKCYGESHAKSINEKEQGNWNFTSRTFAWFICLLREYNRPEYLKIHDMLTLEQKDKFDRKLSQFFKKFNGASFRKSNVSNSPVKIEQLNSIKSYRETTSSSSQTT